MRRPVLEFSIVVRGGMLGADAADTIPSCSEQADFPVTVSSNIKQLQSLTKLTIPE
jgi:hypothetical protein